MRTLRKQKKGTVVMNEGLIIIASRESARIPVRIVAGYLVLSQIIIQYNIALSMVNDLLFIISDKELNQLYLEIPSTKCETFLMQSTYSISG